LFGKTPAPVEALTMGNPAIWVQPEGEDVMIKKLTTSAAMSFLLLGASGVAMAQEVPTLPPLVVFSVQTTPDIVVEPPIAVAVRVWTPFRPFARSPWSYKG